MNTVALSPGSWICCILASVLTGFPLWVRLWLWNSRKSTQDSFSSCLNGEAKKRVSAPHCRKTQCVGYVRPLPVHVECLLTELKHISLGWLKNFYWFPIGLKSRSIFWSWCSLPSELFSHVHWTNLSVCKVSVLLVNRFYLLSHFKEKHIETQQFLWNKRMQGAVWEVACWSGVTGLPTNAGLGSAFQNRRSLSCHSWSVWKSQCEHRKDSWGEMAVFLIVKWCHFSAVSIWNKYCCVVRQMTAQYNAFLIMWLKWNKWVFYQILKFLRQWVNKCACKEFFSSGKKKQKQNKKKNKL